MPDYFSKPQRPLRNAESHNFFLVAQKYRNMVGCEPQEFRNTRAHERTTRSISVSIQPLDEDFQPVGDLFWVVSRDISPKGMGLICHEPFTFDYVRTGLLNEQITVISRVRHNTSIGESYPLFLVGIEFVNEWEIV